MLHDHLRKKYMTKTERIKEFIFERKEYKEEEEENVSSNANEQRTQSGLSKRKMRKLACLSLIIFLIIGCYAAKMTFYPQTQALLFDDEHLETGRELFSSVPVADASTSSSAVMTKHFNRQFNDFIRRASKHSTILSEESTCDQLQKWLDFYVQAYPHKQKDDLLKIMIDAMSQTDPIPGLEHKLLVQLQTSAKQLKALIDSELQVTRENIERISLKIKRDYEDNKDNPEEYAYELERLHQYDITKDVFENEINDGVLIKTNRDYVTWLTKVQHKFKSLTTRGPKIGGYFPQITA